MLVTLMPTWFTPLFPGIRFPCAPTDIAAPPASRPITKTASVRARAGQQVITTLRAKAYFGFGYMIRPSRRPETTIRARLNEGVRCETTDFDLLRDVDPGGRPGVGPGV